MRSDARKRLAEENDAHRIHPDPAVCALVERERQKAAAEAWDEGFQAACDELPIDSTPDGPTDDANPYREAAS